MNNIPDPDYWHGVKNQIPGVTYTNRDLVSVSYCVRCIFDIEGELSSHDIMDTHDLTATKFFDGSSLNGKIKIKLLKIQRIYDGDGDSHNEDEETLEEKCIPFTCANKGTVKINIEIVTSEMSYKRFKSGFFLGNPVVYPFKETIQYKSYALGDIAINRDDTE